MSERGLEKEKKTGDGYDECWHASLVSSRSVMSVKDTLVVVCRRRATLLFHAREPGKLDVMSCRLPTLPCLAYVVPSSSNVVGHFGIDCTALSLPESYLHILSYTHYYQSHPHTPPILHPLSSIFLSTVQHLHDNLQTCLRSSSCFRFLHNLAAAAKSNRLSYSNLQPITMSAYGYDPDPYESRRHRAAGPPTTSRDPRDHGTKPRPRRDRYDADDSDDEDSHPRRSHHRSAPAPAVKSPDTTVPPPPIGRNRGGGGPEDDHSPPSRHSRRDRGDREHASYGDEDPHRSARHRSSHRRPRDPYADADDDGNDDRGAPPSSRRHRDRGTADAYYADDAPPPRRRHEPPSRDKSRGGSGGVGGDPRDRRHRSQRPSRYDDAEEDSDHAPPPARPRRSHRERDRDDDRGYRSEHHSKRHDRDDDGRGYRTDGRETRREREKRKERERERERDRGDPRDKPRSRRYDDDYDDRDADRYDDRRRSSRREREGAGRGLPKVKPKEIMEKGQKGWEQVKPVAGPLLGTLAKAYLEKGAR